jgi:hypothetical protein
MSKEIVYEIPLDVKGEHGNESVPITVRITVQDGNIARIEAVGNNARYIGTLTLHEQSKKYNEGGDECIVCDPRCRVVTPCPQDPQSE